MARPITQIEPRPVDPVKQRNDKKNELIDAMLERKASIETLMDLVGKLEDRGILDLLNGLVGKGDKVLGVAMHELNKPGVSDTLDHLMNLGALISKVETKKLAGLADRINKGIEMAETAAESGEKTSLFDLLAALKDPDVNRAVTTLIGFLKGLGSAQAK